MRLTIAQDLSTSTGLADSAGQAARSGDDPEHWQTLEYMLERTVQRSLNAWFSYWITLASVVVLLVWSAQYWDDVLLFLLGLIVVLIEQLRG